VGLGFIVFWVQVGYTGNNAYYKEEKSVFVENFKSFEKISGMEKGRENSDSIKRE
jgi:hypothetical protein